MQFQADILRTDIILPSCLETTALGVSYLAGLESGFFSSLATIEDLNNYKKIYKFDMPKEEVEKRYNGWKKAIDATRIFKN